MLILSVVGLIITIKRCSFNFQQIQLQYFCGYTLALLGHYLISSLPTPIFIGDDHYMSSFWLHRLSLVSSYISPVKIGLPIKVYFFKKYLGISVSRTSAAVIFESTIYILIVIFAGILFGGTKYITFDRRLILILCIVIAFLFLLRKYFKQFLKSSRLIRIARFTRNVRNSVNDGLKNWQRSLLVTGILLIVTTLTIWRVDILLLAIGEPLSFMQVSRTVLVTSLLATISMVPSGFVVHEVALSFFLVQEGVSLEGSILVVLLDRVLATGSSFVLGSIASLVIIKKFVNLDRKILE